MGALRDFEVGDQPDRSVGLTIAPPEGDAESCWTVAMAAERRWFTVTLYPEYRQIAKAFRPDELRYRGRLVVGSKVKATVAILGAEPGAVGIVYEVYNRSGSGASEGYSVIFAHGSYDGFSPDDVDNFLTFTDEVSERYRGYQFLNVGRLARDFDDPSEFVLTELPLRRLLNIDHATGSGAGAAHGAGVGTTSYSW